ncbi:MAG TPA: hypothetical protein VMU34_15240 [Mycobacterium sp.]|nr:hypothetical protein [Mycobacterium sp.]
MTITVHDHAHSYELAWRPTDDGPVITDLRVMSDHGVPITSDSLRRINTARLANAAQVYDTDIAADLGRILGDDAETYLADVMCDPDPAKRVAGVLAWLENSGDEFAAEVAAELRRSAKAQDLSDLAEGFDAWWARRGQSFVISPGVVADAFAAEATKRGIVPPRKRRGGRPREYSTEFLMKVAKWAREGVIKGSVYEYVAQRAVDSGEKSRYDAMPGAVRWWIKRCKEAGLLGAEELRKPHATTRKDR